MLRSPPFQVVHGGRLADRAGPGRAHARWPACHGEGVSRGGCKAGAGTCPCSAGARDPPPPAAAPAACGGGVSARRMRATLRRPLPLLQCAPHATHAWPCRTLYHKQAPLLPRRNQGPRSQGHQACRIGGRAPPPCCRQQRPPLAPCAGRSPPAAGQSGALSTPRSVTAAAYTKAATCTDLGTLRRRYKHRQPTSTHAPPPHMQPPHNPPRRLPIRVQGAPTHRVQHGTTRRGWQQRGGRAALTSMPARMRLRSSTRSPACTQEHMRPAASAPSRPSLRAARVRAAHARPRRARRPPAL
jgi:hypothetical protein